MSSSDSIIINNLNNTLIYIYKYIGIFAIIIGNIGNFISLYIFSKKSWKKNVCVFYFNIYIISALFYINGSLLTQTFILGYNTQLHNTNVFFCKMYYYIGFVCSTISPTILILASIDRLLISSQNVDRRLYSSKRLAYFSISLSCFSWIIFNCHVLVKVNIQKIFPWFSFCYYDYSQIYQNFITYSIMIINLIFYILMLILSILSFKNVRCIRIIPRQQRNQIRTMTKKDFQLLRCLYAHDIVFITFTLSLIIYYIYLGITHDYTRTLLEQTIVNFVGLLSDFIYGLSYCISFFLFIGISKTFRQEFKRIIYRIFQKEIITSRENGHRQETY